MATIIEVNCLTGVSIEREMTDEELAQYEVDKLAAETE